MSKFKISMILIAVMGIGIFIYFNVFNNCEIYEDEITVWFERYSEEEYGDSEYDDRTFEALVDRHEGKDTEYSFNEEELVRTNRELPSDKAEDYGVVIVHTKIKNHSIFALTDIQGSLGKTSEDSRILYSMQSVVTPYVDGLKSESDIDFIWFEMYMGDMSDEELLDYIRGQEVYVYYNSKLKGVGCKKISLSNAELEQKQ